jgi:multidrug efflux pump subunit AcrA (membrane-fusion protein)
MMAVFAITNMSGAVNLDQTLGVLIPTTAVTSIGAQNFVFAHEKEKAKEGQENAKERLVVRQKPIQVGTIQGQAYQVISGVNAGEKNCY